MMQLLKFRDWVVGNELFLSSVLLGSSIAWIDSSILLESYSKWGGVMDVDIVMEWH